MSQRLREFYVALALDAQLLGRFLRTPAAVALEFGLTSEEQELVVRADGEAIRQAMADQRQPSKE